MTFVIRLSSECRRSLAGHRTGDKQGGSRDKGDPGLDHDEHTNERDDTGRSIPLTLCIGNRVIPGPGDVRSDIHGIAPFRQALQAHKTSGLRQTTRSLRNGKAKRCPLAYTAGGHFERSTMGLRNAAGDGETEAGA